MDEMTWDDLPPQTWPANALAPAEELAAWLTSLTRDQLVWVLGRMQQNWGQDSLCFVENHPARIEDANRIIRADADRWQAGYNQGIADANYMDASRG